MDDATRIVGAFIITYFVRLAIFRGLGIDQRKFWRLFAANFVSASFCAMFAGFAKAAFTVFNAEAAPIYFFAQLCWLLFDVWRGPFLVRKGS